MLPTSSSRPTTRASAFALLALFVAAQSGALWHQATERHAICVEHGDVVEAQHGGHSEGQAEGQPEIAPERTREAAGVEWSKAAGEADAAEHAHCEVVARRREEVTTPAVSAALTVTRFEAPLLLVADRVAQSGAPSILRFAPKASPPL